MSGAPDPLYVAARQVLLDALDALSAHHESIVLVGAQAVYVHAGEADLAVAPFTTDGDLAVDPRRLAGQPLIEIALGDAGFLAEAQMVGTWTTTVPVNEVPTIVAVDLLVPESLAGAGRRGARIPPHAKHAARKVKGLEATLVDCDLLVVQALDSKDTRKFSIRVAGPAALIVAKVHKILDREAESDRLSDKDALDVVRLLVAVPTEQLAGRFSRLLNDDLSRPVTERSIAELSRLFSSSDSAGAIMAVRAAGVFATGDTIASAGAVLTGDLIDALRRL